MAHHGDDVQGPVVSVVDKILVLFLLWKFYGAGVFVPAKGYLAILQAIFFNFWQYFGICLFISLFVRTNRASTCMYF
jgi:hypothetical protein